MKFTFFLAIGLLLLSCSSKTKTFTILFENSNGLIIGNSVMINNQKVGEVTDVQLSTQFKINVTIELDNEICLPKDSQFSIGNSDVFNKAVIIQPGKSKNQLSALDKIKGIILPSMKLDSIISDVTDKINQSNQQKNQDTIEKEMQVLKEKIEGMKVE